MQKNILTDPNFIYGFIQYLERMKAASYARNDLTEASILRKEIAEIKQRLAAVVLEENYELIKTGKKVQFVKRVTKEKRI